MTEENFTFDLIKSKNMSKASKQPTQKVEINESAKTDEGKAKVFVKSDWPKTPKETIKLVVNTFLNFFS